MTTFDELTVWAGTGNVTRADSAVVSGWQIRGTEGTTY